MASYRGIGVHTMHTYIITVSDFMAKTLIIGNIRASITPISIDLIVGFSWALY
jgi:hypothetical protein